MKRLLSTLLCGIAAVPLAMAAQAEEAQLPRTMIWTSYDLGSSGYAEASAIANAIMKKYNTRVRIVPSGTSIGRLLPVTTDKAQYGFLANEAYFASEGTFDFAVPSWGPQDIRIALGKPAANALAVAADAGIKTPYDLKGKRIGYVKGNPSVNVKQDAYLAFAGLTRDDIEVVWYGSYAALKDAVIQNQIDGYSSVTTSGNMREIEASPRGLSYMEYPPDDKEGWEKLKAVASFFEPMRETRGAGLSEDNPKNLIGVRYPMITTYARTSDDEVYNLVKAIDSVYEDFKDSTSTGIDWELARAGRPPADGPWHDGTIRLMKERGLWRPEDQAWHEERLARLEKVIEAWGNAQEEFNVYREEEAKKGNKIDPETAWEPFWEDYRTKHLTVGG